MTSRADIIKAQESIGNVEISAKEYLDAGFFEKVKVIYPDGMLYFAPREVVHPEETEAFGGKLLISDEEKIGCGKRYCPSCHKYLEEDVYDEYAFHCGDGAGQLLLLCPACQKKKDNHSQNKELAGSVEPAIPDATDEEPSESGSRIKDGSDIQSSKIFEDEVLKEVLKKIKFHDGIDYIGLYGNSIEVQGIENKDFFRILKTAIRTTKRKMGED